MLWKTASRNALSNHVGKMLLNLPVVKHVDVLVVGVDSPSTAALAFQRFGQRILATYGEEPEQDCGICDVCLRRKALHSDLSDEKEALRRHILSQLQRGPVNSYELDLAGFGAAVFEEVIDAMRSSGEISFDGPLLSARPS